MNFLVDENFPKSSISTLLNNGHQVFDIRGTNKQGCNDEEIFNIAQQNEAIFLTTDRDFFHTIHFINKNHFGIIVFNLRQPNRFKINEKLEWIINQEIIQNLNSKALLITDDKYYLR